jgi:hypothetical protein
MKVLVQVILEKRKLEAGEPNDYSFFWKAYTERVFMHKLNCEYERCVCKKRRQGNEVDDKIYIYDLLKMVQGAEAVLGKYGRIKILNINILV